MKQQSAWMICGVLALFCGIAVALAGDIHEGSLGYDEWLSEARDRFGMQENGTLPAIQARLEGDASAQSALQGVTDVVGEHPRGFGKFYMWDRRADQTLVIYLNAADDLGVAILGLQRGDAISIVSAGGLASFSEDRRAEILSSFVAVIAPFAGSAAPLLSAGEQLARTFFDMAGEKDKRDAYGWNPDWVDWNEQEGGVIVCMPGSGGPYYSGSNRVLWVEGKEPRIDERRPFHVREHGFFLLHDYSGGHNTRQAERDGIVHILAWDFEFADNQGYYVVIVQLRRGG